MPGTTENGSAWGCGAILALDGGKELLVGRRPSKEAIEKPWTVDTTSRKAVTRRIGRARRGLFDTMLALVDIVVVDWVVV
jgi:hypothetical protein